MPRPAVIAEGKTERNFVEKILNKHLLKHGVLVSAPNLCGIASIPEIKKSLARLIHNFDFVSTLVDHYGFRKRKGRSADELETVLRELAGTHRHRFIPYIQRHEFEALLFADKTVMANHLQLDLAQRKELQKIKAPPEQINHDFPPSHRLKEIHPKDRKALDGLHIARETGLPAIMNKCPGFAAWVRSLEALEAPLSTGSE